MTESSMLILVVVLVFFLLAMGIKVAWALGISGFLVAVSLFGAGGLRIIGSIAYDRGTSFALTCMPLFIFMGEMIMRSGMNDTVFGGMERLTRGVPGGILQTTIGTSAVFAASTGSNVACTATVASVAYPSLVERGYPKELSATTISAAGALGILIPPSMQFVIYASLVGESISELFIAGILPGVMLTFMFCGYIVLRALLQPHTFPAREKGHLIRNLSGLISMWPIAILIFLVLFTMYFGIATPTEAAAFGAVGSLLLTFVYQRKDFFRVLYEGSIAALRTTSMIMFLIIGASIFTFVLTHLRLTDMVLDGVSRWGVSPWIVFVLIGLVYIVLGMFLDAVSMMVLSLPILYPVVTHLGFNGVWFGVIVVIWLEVAWLTPPFCMGLFILSGITKISIVKLIPEMIPFIGIFWVAIVLMYIFPDIALWLVSMMK